MPDIGGDCDRINPLQLPLAIFTPFEEPQDRAGIGLARIRIGNLSRKVFNEAPGGFLAGSSDGGGNERRPSGAAQFAGWNFG